MNERVVACSQDTDSLLGHMSLADVLRKRCGASFGVPAFPEVPDGTDAHIVTGFAELVLSGLANSDQARQHEFAQQVIKPFRLSWP
jgi:hypothetical protein